jgi:hypothetical protein
LIAHLERFNLKSGLFSISRIFKFGRYLDKWMLGAKVVIKDSIRIIPGAPPPSPFNDPDVKEELIQCMLLGDEQKRCQSDSLDDSFSYTRKREHLESMFRIANGCLLSENGVIEHYCQMYDGCPPDPDDAAAHCAASLHADFTSLHEAGSPIFLPTRFTKIFCSPSFLLPSLCICNIGRSALEFALKIEVDDATKHLREAALRDEVDIDFAVINSKRLVEGYERMCNERMRFDMLLFVCLGRRFLPLLWTVFEADNDGGTSRRVGGKPKATLLDIQAKTREVQTCLRTALLPESPMVKTLLAFKPSAMTESDAYMEIRASTMCMSSDLYVRLDCPQIHWPKKAAEFLRLVSDARLDELYDDFMGRNDCCLKDSFCVFLKRKLGRLPH